MSDIAIKIENLGKRYRYGGVAPLSANLRADVTEWVRGVFRRGHRSRQPEAGSLQVAGLKSQPSDQAHDPSYFWALKDINLDVRQGEVVGLIGRNGAGKSTLLKILSRITSPTDGRVTYRGRMASLLEVGTGFSRELTGRENIFLNGSILGMRRAEIVRKLDEIVAFAEIDKFLDTPVKFYSSGMYVRLAFAVAAHLEPDILLIDEVLAVGDAAFQKKCLGKIENVSSSGRTILFVSHNMSAIESICGRVWLLDRGRLVADGTPSQVVASYGKSCGGGGEISHVITPHLNWLGIANRNELDNLSPKDDLRFVFAFRTGPRSLTHLHIDLAIYNEKGEIVIHTRSKYVGEGFAIPAETNFNAEYTIISPKLAPGAYTMTVHCDANGEVLYWADNIDACHIGGKSYFGQMPYYDQLKSAIIPEFQVHVRTC